VLKSGRLLLRVGATPEGALRATLGCWSLRDFPALLASGGVWLNSASPQTTPALIHPPLRCSAASKGGAQCALRRGRSVAQAMNPDCVVVYSA